MKYNIRLAIFETNSSSTHSLSINKDTILYESLNVDRSGNVYISSGEFGWEVEQYRHADVKASYCFTWIKQECSGETENRYLEMLKKAIKEHTQCKNVIFQDEDGYIDHQSDDVCFEVFESEETLKNFIFNVNSTLTTANDNEDCHLEPLDIIFNSLSSFENIRFDNLET